MPVNVVCPFCSKELSSPDDLVGKQVACPRCNKQFAIAQQGNGSGQSAQPQSPTAPAYIRSQFAPGQQPAAPPVQTSLPPVASVNSHGATGTAGEAVPPQSSPSQPDSPPNARPAAKRPIESTGRTVKVAKFVADGAVQSRLELGQDGQLPQLIANAGKQDKELDDESEKDNSAWLLVGVMCFSVLMSVIMLFVPTDSTKVSSDEKAEAREKIKEFYIGDGADIKPYQQLLRGALQAYNRGDENLELRVYRRVLHMLRSEEAKKRGLTRKKWMSGSSWRDRESAPNDREWEELLSVLLR